MRSKTKLRTRTAFFVYLTAAIVGLGLFIYLIGALRELVLPLIVAALLAYIFRPLLNAFKYPWLPNGLRLAFILALVVGGISFLVHEIRLSVPDDRERLELMVRLKYKLNERYASIMGLDYATDKGNAWYGLLHKELDPLMEKANDALKFTPEADREFRKYHDGFYGEQKKIPDKFYQYYLANTKHPRFGYEASEAKDAEKPVVVEEPHSSNAGYWMHILEIWITTPLVLLFLLFDNGQSFKWFISLFPNRFFELTRTIFDEVDQAMGKYLRGTLMECALVGSTIGIGLWIIGVDYKASLGIGLVGGLTNVIPFLGTVIGFAVGLFYVLIAENISPLLPFIPADGAFLGVLVVVAITHILDNTVYQPIVMGSAVDLHPIVIIVGVIGGSMLFGFAGMLLAIPGIVICKVLTQTLFAELKAYKII